MLFISLIQANRIEACLSEMGHSGRILTKSIQSCPLIVIQRKSCWWVSMRRGRMKFNQFNWYVEIRIVCLNGFEDKEVFGLMICTNHRFNTEDSRPLTIRSNQAKPKMCFCYVEMLAISICLYCDECIHYNLGSAQDSVSVYFVVRQTTEVMWQFTTY